MTTLDALSPTKPKIVAATLVSQTYDRLRDDIVNARFSPGQKLGTRQLSERYGVGLAPLREALTRLSGEGLVIQLERRGFAVPNFGGAHLEELTRTRCWLNETGLRASIEYADKTWEQGLILAYHQLSRLDRYVETQSEAVENPEWEMAHRDFHIALIAGCRSSWLVDFCTQMFDTANYYRHYSRISLSSRKTRENEHDKLFQATLAHDADTAARLLCKHLNDTAQRVQIRIAEEALKGSRPRKLA